MPQSRRIAANVAKLPDFPAFESINAGKTYYGEVPILGTPYITGYEPITDSSGAQIGVYYVGYKK